MDKLKVLWFIIVLDKVIDYISDTHRLNKWYNYEFGRDEERLKYIDQKNN